MELGETLAHNPDEPIAGVGITFLLESGLIWKLNSEFLWPLGLALAVAPIDPDAATNGPVVLALMATTDGSPWTAPPNLVEDRQRRWDAFLLAAEPLRQGIVLGVHHEGGATCNSNSDSSKPSS